MMEVDSLVPSTELESENTNNTEPSEPSTSRLGLCEVCAFHQYKYTCPKCEVKTCSLKCNKIHKLEVECDGQRDRTKFIPINKFTNLDLSSDYRLLEEISRTLETSRKKFGRRADKNTVPYYLIKLQNAAKDRSTTLKFLPYKFARRRNNSTQLKANIIYWHIEWVFVNANNLKVTDKRVPETEKLCTVFSKYLVKQENEVLQEKLQFYQAADTCGLKLCLKAEQKGGQKFYDLDPSVSVKECLAKKLIIEYPIIHVIFKDQSSGYNIIDSDDETVDQKTTVKTGNKVIEDIISNAENEDKLYKSLKNLLFISEYSDEEQSDSD